MTDQVGELRLQLSNESTRVVDGQGLAFTVPEDSAARSQLITELRDHLEDEAFSSLPLSIRDVMAWVAFSSAVREPPLGSLKEGATGISPNVRLYPLG